MTEEALDTIKTITPVANAVTDAQGMANSLRSKILGIQDSKTELVVIPEWDNVEIEFHSLTGAEKSEWLARLDFASEDATTEAEKARRLQLFVELAVYTAYLPGTDTKIFEANDSSWLLKKSAKALSRLEDTVGLLNGFVKDSKDKSAEKAKNF
jgi:hypothetical protein